MEVGSVSPRDTGGATTPTAEDQAALTASYRSSSLQPNEKLLLYVKDFSLADRLLNVRIYQVSHTSAGATAVSDCVGYRVAATDEGENDYALFISRVKGEQLYKAEFPERTEPMTGEAVGSSILTHLDIVGNRHRDVGRMICRDPQVSVSKKERVAPPPKTPSKQRNSHLPSKEQDKRMSRNKQSQQRTHEAIAASHEQLTHETDEHHGLDTAHGETSHASTLSTHSHFTAHGEVTEEIPKGRKSSDMNLLHRMANADATTIWRADLGAIDDDVDENEELIDEEEGGEEVTSPGHLKATPAQYKRVVPERKAKHKELQQRRDKERHQRLHPPKVIAKSPSKDTSARQGSPPRLATNSPSPTRRRASLVNPATAAAQVPASIVIGNAHALKTFVGASQPEQEQFLRRKTTLKNERRVFKTEGVFDDTLDVEITSERPDHRTMEYVPGSPVASANRRTLSTRRSKTTPQTGELHAQASPKESVIPVAAASQSAKVSPRPELGALESGVEASAGKIEEAFASDDEAPMGGDDDGDVDEGENQSVEDDANVADRRESHTDEEEGDDADADSAKEEDETKPGENDADQKLEKQAGDELREDAEEPTEELSEGPAAELLLEDPSDEPTDAIGASDEPLGAADNDLQTELLLPALVFDTHESEELKSDPTPRSSRLHTARTIHIVEEEETEETQDAPQGQSTQEGLQQAESNESPRPEEEQPLDQQLVTTVMSPRVECWEEEEAPQAERDPDAQEAMQAEESSGAAAAVDEPLPVETSWASVPESQPTEENDVDTEQPPMIDTVAAEAISEEEADNLIPDQAARQEAESIAEVEPLKPQLLFESPSDNVIQASVAAAIVAKAEELPSHRAAIEADDPIIEVEPLRQSLPVETPLDNVVVDHSRATVEVSAQPTVPPESSSLKRSVKPNAARRASILDVHASAIAAAAAAAAVTAVPAPPVEEVKPKRSPPKSASKKKKRRSHDGIPALTAASVVKPSAQSRREKIRRSTLHGLPSLVLPKSPVKKSSDAGDGESISDDAAESALAPTAESSEPTPPSTGTSTDETESQKQHHAKTHHPSPSHDDHSHHQQPQHHKRTQQETEALQRSPGYHTKWDKWKNGKQLIEKVSCLQLEEKLMEDPHDENTLVKLGVRYARWPSTSLAAALLLEHASGPQQDGAGQNHEYWNSLGNAHFDVFLRHRKFLPIASFHLGKCMQAFTRAFAYLESLADPLLLLRYAIALYWKKSDNNMNLERADDILREMFVKFATFCDHDRGNLLFLHFQILCRLKMYGDAMDCLRKIMVIHNASLEATSAGPHPGTPTPAEVAAAPSNGAPTPYDSNDYLLMMMHCQQASGDFLQSSATFTQLLKQLHGYGVDSCGGVAALEDHDYLRLWGSLADKCFLQEDYALAVEFYGLAATYAKDSRVLAHMLYNHALCNQAIGEHIKCNAEFKRAKNLNRHVMPFATIAEIHARYDDTYATLLRTPVDWIIEEVRQTLYDRAVSVLQRMFRRRLKAQSDEAADASKSTNRIQSGGARGSIDRRRQSIAGLAHLGGRNLPGADGSSTRNLLETDETSDGSVVVDFHDEFLKRHGIALKKLEKMRERSVQKSKSFSAQSDTAVVPQQSGLLSPWKDRPDLRRKHSMDAFAKQFGYVPGGRARYGEYWEQLVGTALDLYETRKLLDRHVARIRSTLPLVSEAVACCALADALGDVEVALERLHDTTYEHELQLVSGIMDVGKLLHHHFTSVSSDMTAATRFPPIASPVRTSQPPASTSSPASISKHTASPSKSLPPCSPSPKIVRLSSLIDAQFTAVNRAAVQEQTTSVLGKQLHAVDRFAVMDDFRQVNTSLLHGWQR